MALSDELEMRILPGALSYNRADTQNPAFGFSEAGLVSLLAEVRASNDDPSKYAWKAKPCDRFAVQHHAMGKSTPMHTAGRRPKIEHDYFRFPQHRDRPCGLPSLEEIERQNHHFVSR